MKKAILTITSFVFILSSCLIETSALAWGRDPELLPSQKEEIREVLAQIRSHEEEIEKAKKEMDDLYNGEDEAFNNNSFVIELQKEGEDILASSVGQRLGRKMKSWDKTDKTKPLRDFLNKEEFEAFKRITEIGNKLEDMRDDKLEGRRLIIGNARTTIGIKEEELKKLEEKYGKAAVDALRGEVEERENEVYQIDAYPVNEKAVGAKGQVSISLYIVHNNAQVLINLKNRKVTSDNVMNIEHLTVKNNYPLSEFKKTEDKVFFTINSVEYEHILYVKHSLIGLGMGSKNTLRKDWEKKPYHKSKETHDLKGVINLRDSSFNGKCGKLIFKGSVTVK